MVRLREVPRTAAFAWSPGASLPFIATGSKAGAVDADFSTDTQLELWDLDLEKAHLNQELQPVASITTDSRFYDLAWTNAGESSKKGVIAGALENGALDVWDADKLLSSDSSALVSHTTKHSGAIKALQFNAFRHELLATAGAKGELYINDLNNLANPFKLGNTAARADDFECLDWNKKVPHIMVTGSSGGFVTVWDVKSKKENLTLNNQGRKAVSAVAWDPEQSTRLITAVPLDQSPVILIWDLRNTNQPQQVLQGHEGGVLSLSWCKQDPDLLLSCGKDNRTICWNPQTAQAYGDFPVVTNWTFQTSFNPHNPDLLATASFDGKIAVQTLQNTKPDTSEASKAQALDGADFFANAQNQPQASSFSLPKAPSWLERPCGVSFGFGGKIVKFGLSGDGAAPQKSTISISSFAIDEDIWAVTEAFAKSMSAKDLTSVCEARISQATLESEKTDWKVIETLTAENPRKELINYIGVYKEGEEPTGVNGTGDDTSPTANGAKDDASFFEGGQDGDNFLSGIASTKGAKTNNPFQLFDNKESDVEKKITKLLLLGQFEKAMEVCLIENRLSDAFMIAMCGGQKCMDRVQKAYFKVQRDGPNYVRLLASVVGKNLWDLVYNADLKDWREVMATLCTYASADEFPDLCEALGERLEDLSKRESDHSQKQNASFCYIAGSKLEKVVGVWIQELEYNEQKGLKEDIEGSSFSIHAKALQTFIEKVTIFREVTKYQDKQRSATENWKLQELYEKYIEYADIVASHGQLEIASQYLSLLPEQYPAADVARNRVRQAINKPSAAPVARAAHQSAASRTFIPAQPATVSQAPAPVPFAQPTPFSNPAAPQAPNPYAPTAPTQSNFSQSGPYAPLNTNSYTSSNPYAPQQPMQMPSRAVVAPPPTFSQGPPRTSTASPAIAPAATQKNLQNWNDTPADFFKAPTSRRATPAQPPVTTAPPPFATTTPPMGNAPFVIPKTIPAPAPPPPKGPAPPARVSTPQMNQSAAVQPPVRPPSSAANNYAPPPTFATQPTQIPRGPSPYNPPPVSSGPVPVGRYAPALGSTPQPQMQPAPPQPITRGPPPPNPYASRQSFSHDQPFGQNALQQRGPPQGPPQGPPMGNFVQPPQQSAAPPPPPKTEKPPTPKFPPGDRSHIPAEAQPIFNLLSADMQRVKARAPPQFAKHVEDTEKRLNILFDNLNNQTMLKPNTVQDMVRLAEAVQNKDYDTAMNIHLDIFSHRTAECGNWMPGIKRLITMSRATAS